MSEKNDAFWAKEQAEIDPRIEEEILELLDGDLKENALGFVAYLRKNNLMPKQWFGPNYWRIPYGEDFLCGIHTKKDAWRFWFFKGDYSGAFDESFIKTVQDHVRPCILCTTDCPRGKDMTVFGKEFVDTCFQFPVQFENPDGSALECIKELIEYWKGSAPYSDSWHCH